MKIILNPDQNLWFTSDTHYNHYNIVKSITKWEGSRKDRTRDFESLEQMNEVIVEHINSFVKEDDILIHLGDWSFGGFDSIKEFRDKIKCKNIHLVLGNHDHHIANNKNNIQDLFSSVHEYLFLQVNIPVGPTFTKHRFVCMHYPIASWNGMSEGIVHLHGHTHLPPEYKLGKGKSLDVGIDGNYYFPISISQINYMMKKQPIHRLILPIDHHEEKILKGIKKFINLIKQKLCV